MTRRPAAAPPCMADTKLVLALNRLLRLDYDAAEAYQAAVDRLLDPVSKKAMAAFKSDHLRHTRALRPVVRGLGGDPAGGPDLKRVLTKGLVLLANLAGDRMILRAMKKNEDLTNAGYQAALRLRRLAPGLRSLLKRHLADERRHRDWIVGRLRGVAPPLPARKKAARSA